MTRVCIKCKEQLIVDEKLQLMVCVTNNHIEPINLRLAQWWFKCDCGQMGLNTRDQEPILQSIIIKDGKRSPEIKNKHLVFNRQANVKPVTCRACGKTFTKRE